MSWLTMLRGRENGRLETTISIVVSFFPASFGCTVLSILFWLVDEHSDEEVSKPFGEPLKALPPPMEDLYNLLQQGTAKSRLLAEQHRSNGQFNPICEHITKVDCVKSQVHNTDSKQPARPCDRVSFSLRLAYYLTDTPFQGPLPTTHSTSHRPLSRPLFLPQHMLLRTDLRPLPCPHILHVQIPTRPRRPTPFRPRRRRPRERKSALSIPPFRSRLRPSTRLLHRSRKSRHPTSNASWAEPRAQVGSWAGRRSASLTAPVDQLRRPALRL